MTLRNGTNYASPRARISISESDIIDKRDDLFYEITTTGSAAGYSLHDLIEIVDDEFNHNIIAMLMRGIDVDDTKESRLDFDYGNVNFSPAWESAIGDAKPRNYLFCWAVQHWFRNRLSYWAVSWVVEYSSLFRFYLWNKYGNNCRNLSIP